MNKTRKLLFILLGWLLFLAVGAEATQTCLVLSGGFFNFSNSQFRQLYGSVPAVSLSLDFFLRSRLGIGSGIFYYRTRGKALNLVGESDNYEINFNRLTIPILVKYRLSWKRFQALAALGLAFSRYRESWQEVELSSKGESFHFRYEAAAEFNLTTKLFIRASLTGESIPTGLRSPLLGGSQANLAGLSFSFGVGLKI